MMDDGGREQADEGGEQHDHQESSKQTDKSVIRIQDIKIIQSLFIFFFTEQ
jgi:hypothetical protein